MSGARFRPDLAPGVEEELTIGERIRELRRGTFTHNLAAAADVSVDVIRKLEQGRLPGFRLVSQEEMEERLRARLAAG